MKKKLVFLLVLVACVVAAWYLFDLGRYLSFYYIQSKQAEWQLALEQHPLWVALAFFVVYVLVTGLSIPGAAVMTLLAGSLFGLALGTLIVSFASTLGATLAFLLARFIGRDFVQKRFGEQLGTINRGVENEGGFYLFTLRLAPVFPFFLVNILMALTPIRVWSYVWISQVGMLAGTLVYVNAGTQLGQLDSMQGILSPTLIASFVLLGLLPLVAKKIVEFLRAKRAHG